VIDRPADFRSDTVTQPTAAMRAAMAAAEVGDDVLGEDPTVRRLEQEGARWLGQEAALFVPSGTMANQIAVHVHCRSGDELICEERCHVFWFECGSAARLSGVQIRPLRAERGFPSVAEVNGAVRSSDPHFPRSRLLVLENSHNMSGGRVLGVAAFRELTEVAHGLGLRVHVDGARLANAAVALGCLPSALARGADSVSLCLSKGLGAPVGSLLAGGGEFVAAARRARKAFGGGMRQAGVLAAPGLLALEHGARGLVADHERAARLAAGLGGLPGLRVVPPETNIVLVEVLGSDRDAFLAFLATGGVLASEALGRHVRFVTHRDVTDEHVDRCIAHVTRWADSHTQPTRTP
jgi:threonine aldolase